MFAALSRSPGLLLAAAARFQRFYVGDVARRDGERDRRARSHGKAYDLCGPRV